MERSTLVRSVLLGLMLTTGACTPDPEKVCGHLKEVVKDKDMQDDTKCAALVGKMKTDLGEDKWKTFAQCAMEAKDEASAQACMTAGQKDSPAEKPANL